MLGVQTIAHMSHQSKLYKPIGLQTCPEEDEELAATSTEGLGFRVSIQNPTVVLIKHFQIPYKAILSTREIYASEHIRF